jgi:hypothetical protein
MSPVIKLFMLLNVGMARAEQFRARAEQFERQAAKAAAAGRDDDAEQALASAAQWREWADTAVAAVTRNR